MDVKAKLKHLRMSPKKVRLVADLVRDLSLPEGIVQLRFSTKAAARPILKLLNSAIANAEHNFSLNKDRLYIKELRVDQGPVLKRWKYRAFGRAAQVLKKSSHIQVVLGELPSLEEVENELKDKKVVDSLPKEVKVEKKKKDSKKKTS